MTLRAGYSANAEILIEEHRDVLVLPERLAPWSRLPSRTRDRMPLMKALYLDEQGLSLRCDCPKPVPGADVATGEGAAVRPSSP